jgi:hypothetical protein
MFAYFTTGLGDRRAAEKIDPSKLHKKSIKRLIVAIGRREKY